MKKEDEFFFFFFLKNSLEIEMQLQIFGVMIF